jgi:hypothetical protein
MPRDRLTRMSLATGLSAVLGICTLAGTTAAATASTSRADSSAVTPSRAGQVARTQTAVDDTFVDSRAPRRSSSTSTRLVAGTSAHRSTSSLVKFRVPATPTGYVRSAARLHLLVTRSTGARVVVRSVSSGWRGHSVSYHPGALAGRAVASSTVGARQRSLDVGVSTGLRTGSVSFAIVATRGTTQMRSRESGSGSSPRLVLSYTPQVDVPRSAAAAATAVKIGMSAPAAQWSKRLSEVGAGVTARRIFADLGKGSDDQMTLIDQTFKAGMMPVISYKLGGDAAGAKAGRFDAAAKRAAARIAAYNRPATVSIWHEPQGDLSAADFVAVNQRLVPLFKVGQIKVGPFLNGWLLDRRADTTFASFAPASLVRLWDFLGIDTYESGTMAAPGAVKPAARIPLLVSFEKKRGYHLPIAVGEYNGYSAKSIKDAGDALQSTPDVWFGCMWNSTIGKGYTLTGDRLAAFRATLARTRAAG